MRKNHKLSTENRSLVLLFPELLSNQIQVPDVPIQQRAVDVVDRDDSAVGAWDIKEVILGDALAFAVVAEVDVIGVNRRFCWPIAVIIQDSAAGAKLRNVFNHVAVGVVHIIIGIVAWQTGDLQQLVGVGLINIT
jgi:hypothetical protein